MQYAKDEDNSPLLSKAEKKFVQEVIGVFLYYARAVDLTMLPALGTPATQQAAPTQNTMKKSHQLLDYAATHPDAIITYHASDMLLVVHSDALYLSKSNAHKFRRPTQQRCRPPRWPNHQSRHDLRRLGRA